MGGAGSMRHGGRPPEVGINGFSQEQAPPDQLDSVLSQTLRFLKIGLPFG
jgi:hypothetical protein